MADEVNMQLDEFFAAVCEMVNRGVDPQRLREELECAVKTCPNQMSSFPLPHFVTDSRVPPGEIRIGSYDGPVLMKNIKVD